MIFQPPSWLPPLPQPISEARTVGDFVLGGATPNQSEDDDPITLISAATQKTKTNRQLAQDVEALAAGLALELGWSPNGASPQGGGRVIAVLCENSLDYPTYCWATHRLGATCLLLHASTVPSENASHILHSGCKVLILSSALLEPGGAVAAAVGADLRVYLTQSGLNGVAKSNGFHDTRTVDDLLQLGRARGPLPPLSWSREEAHESIAYLCATSGTSGAQVMTYPPPLPRWATSIWKML